MTGTDRNTVKQKLRPVTVVGDIAFVPLTRGMTAIIDAADAAEIGRYNWSVGPSGKCFYAIRGERVDGRVRMTRMHNMLCETGPGQHVDHIDGDGLNNRRANLRPASPILNALNAERGAPKSGARNVVRMKRSGLWRAFKTEGGKSIQIGDFMTVGDAELAVMRWRMSAIEASSTTTHGEVR